MSDRNCICEVCRARVSELRRGRCWGCYERWVEARPVGLGARCITCNEKRRRFLKTVELYGSWRPMCFNCAGIVFQLAPMPKTIFLLKEAVSRERRHRDRRFGKPDTRVFVYERRVGERRTPRPDDAPSSDTVGTVDDDMIIEISIDMDMALAEMEPSDRDITQIREMVQALRPNDLRA